MDGKLSLKGEWLGHVNHLNFGGHQPYLWNNWCCQLRWMASAVNWWRSWS